MPAGLQGLRVPSKGHYVVAVSGGVDSMVLIYVLQRIPGLTLTVAHFDHGIRPESREDAKLVEAYCKEHGLAFRLGQTVLGPDASEAQAREARYAFLRMALKETGAKAIITAHHADDVLETAVINMLRGTSPRGLQALDTHQQIIRPLLDVSKQDIKKYAKVHGIVWREDATNADTKYLRNYVRQNIIPKLDREQVEDLIRKQRVLTEQADFMLRDLQDDLFRGNELKRQAFVTLPHEISLALIRNYLDTIGEPPARSRTLESIVHFCKTARNGKSWHVYKNLNLQAGKDHIAFIHEKI